MTYWVPLAGEAEAIGEAGCTRFRFEQDALCLRGAAIRSHAAVDRFVEFLNSAVDSFV